MPSRFHLRYFDPPAELSQHVLAFFHFAWDEQTIADRHPGALPQFVLFPYGNGELQIGDAPARVEGEAHLLAGFERAAPFVMEGPWHAIGASLSPLGWAALTQSPVNSNYNRFIPPAELLEPDVDLFSKQTNDRYRDGEISGPEACSILADWIAPRFKPVPEAHRRLIGATFSWLGTSLNPDIDALHASLPYSRRQAERLVSRYFGLPPTAIARKYRAIRAARLLAEPALSDEAEAEIASAFYDQPHMIREIRRYCGYTPTKLGAQDEPLFQQMLRMKNLERLREFRSIG